MLLLCFHIRSKLTSALHSTHGLDLDAARWYMLAVNGARGVLTCSIADMCPSCQYRDSCSSTVCRVNKVMSGGRTKTEKRNMKISEARPLLEEAESDRLINQDTVSRPHFACSTAVLQFELN